MASKLEEAKEKELARYLQDFSDGLSESVCIVLLREANYNVNKAAQEILDMKMDPMEIVRQQDELDRLASAQRLQQQKIAQQREEEERRVAEAKRRREEEMEKLLHRREEELFLQQSVVDEAQQKIDEFAQLLVMGAEESKNKQLEAAKVNQQKNVEALDKIKIKMKEELLLMENDKRKLEELEKRKLAELREKEEEFATMTAKIEKDRLLLNQLLDTTAEKMRVELEKDKAKTEEEKKEISTMWKALEQERLKLREQKIQLDKEAAKLKKFQEEELKKVTPTNSHNSMVASDYGRTQPVAPSSILIYICTNPPKNETAENELEEIESYLFKHGATAEDITVVDVAKDIEVAGILHAVVNGNSPTPKYITYPFVSIHGKPIGHLSDLKLLQASGKLKAALSEPNVDIAESLQGTGGYVGQGVLDHVLDIGEYVTSTVTSTILAPITFVSWLFGSSSAPLPEGVTFDVVHTNWYWRNLKRQFRFCEDSFLRIHPRQGDVRAKHSYNSVHTITRDGKINLVIHYNDGSSPDYIKADEGDCNKMVALIQRHNPEVVVIDAATIMESM